MAGGDTVHLRGQDEDSTPLPPSDMVLGSASGLLGHGGHGSHGSHGSHGHGLGLGGNNANLGKVFHPGSSSTNSFAESVLRCLDKVSIAADTMTRESKSSNAGMNLESNANTSTTLGDVCTDICSTAAAASSRTIEEWEARSMAAFVVAWAVLGLSRDRSLMIWSSYVISSSSWLAFLIPTPDKITALLGDVKTQQMALPQDSWRSGSQSLERITQCKDLCWTLATMCLEMARDAANESSIDLGLLQEQSNSYFKTVNLRLPERATMMTRTTPANNDILSEEMERVLARMPKRSPMLQKWFNEGMAKKVRLNRHIHHDMEPLGFREIKHGPRSGAMKGIQATCAVCGGQATYRCSVCKVPLHRTACAGEPQRFLGEKAATCFERFHTQEQLEEPLRTKRTKPNPTSDRVTSDPSHNLNSQDTLRGLTDVSHGTNS